MFMLFLMLGASLFSVPAFAWCGPPYDGPVGTEDGCFEMFGPRVDNVLIKMYPSAEAEWEALKAGEIDITDWTLTKAYYDEFMSGAYPDIAVADSGGELSVYVLDVRNDPYTNDNMNAEIGDAGDLLNPFGDPTPITIPAGHPYLPPGTVVKRGSQARLALAHLLDREAIITLTGNMHSPMYTHFPETNVFRIGGWINDAAQRYPFDPEKAALILDLAGYVDTDDDGFRNYDSNGDGNIASGDANFVVDFYTRKDLFRSAVGDWLQARLSSEPSAEPPYNLANYGPCIGVNRIPCTGFQAWEYVMLLKVGHLYTASWVLSREPTLHYFLYNSEFYYREGCSDFPNYMGVEDPDIDYFSGLAYTAQDTQTAKQAVLDFQTRMNEPDAVFNIPIANPVVRKAFKKTDSTGALWNGFINSPSHGINNALSQLDTLLNAHPEDMATGGTINYGWKEDTMPSSLNPYQWSWYWDWEVLNRVYSTLIAVNPYNLLGDGPGDPNVDLPWIAESWEIGTTPSGNSKFTFYLRDDVYFHDGTKMTAEDVWYTIKLGFYQAEDHPEYGWEALPPWFWSNIMNIDITKPDEEVMPDGPLGYTIVLYYKVKDIWSFWRAGTGIPIVPKEKWWDKFYPNPTGSDGFAPDPQLIGTGPFKIFPGKVDGTDPDHYTPGSHIKLDKNPTFFRRYQPPAPPKAMFTATPETAKVGEPVKFDASSSLPGWNGTHEMPITEYRWDFGDGNKTTTSTPIVYHTFQDSGIFNVTLTVYAPRATPETNATTYKVSVYWISIPVGGYSFPIEVHIAEKPSTLYVALVVILTVVSAVIMRKMSGETKPKRKA
jgi:ABC-type transport system substrate-binding protein